MYAMWTNEQIAAEIIKVKNMQYRASRRNQAAIVFKCEKFLIGLYREQDKRKGAK